MSKKATQETPKSWTVNKSDWGEGPWQHEPDRVEWRHKGFPCLIVRHSEFGNFCGYVAVPASHPWLDQERNDMAVSVHGGLTYGPEHCQPTGPICHIPAKGEVDDVQWFGFDCGHIEDLQPGLESHRRESYASGRVQGGYPGAYGTYRDLAYVKGEVESLARQAFDAVV